jgi:hypothetical protein
VQPSKQITHHRELPCTAEERIAVDELRHQDRAAVEVRHRILDREALRGIVLELQEPEDRGVAFDTNPRASRRERARHPRRTVVAVDPKHVGLVHTQLRRAYGADAVAIPEMS